MEALYPSLSVTPDAAAPPIDFAWLELTNRCNLQCSHCYTSSSPTSTDRDILSQAQYVDAIHQLYMLGCRKIQFIGGEPTLNKGIPQLIDAAKECGYDFVEVFTNLVSLPPQLLRKFTERNVAIATSFYSWDRKVHDRITRQIGSFDKTVRNIKQVLAAGLSLRVGIILMAENSDQHEQTHAFLTDLGVERIGSDRVREFGRALADGTACSIDDLCGSCAGNILSIGPDGIVAPCNMSHHWQVGNIMETTLSDIVHSQALAEVRRQIGDAARSRPEPVHATCDPKTCLPYNSCCPTTQSCLPCAPNGCNPCYPKG